MNRAGGQLTRARFGGERLLYRLAKSAFADRFILKWAALLLLWLGEAIRPTKDVDLLGFGDTSTDALKRVFVSLAAIQAPEYGLTFMPESVRVELPRARIRAYRAETSIAEKTEAWFASRWRIVG